MQVFQRREPTEVEKRWIRRLERVLTQCPPTLELATTGDNGLLVWDKQRRLACDAAGVNYVDCKCEGLGIRIADVGSACNIHGICG